MSWRKKSPVRRFPTSLPCWSGKASRTVSISPSSTSWRSSSFSSMPLVGPAMSLHRFEVALDRGELLGRALNLRPHEPLPRRQQVPPAGQDDHRTDGEGRVVQGVDGLAGRAADQYQ